MPVKPRVLCLGADPALNRTRRLLLQPSFEVAVATAFADAAAILGRASRDRQPFHLVLVCYTTITEEAEALVALLEASFPETKILALDHGLPRLRLTPPHLECRPDGPADLVRRIREMTGVVASAPAPQSSERGAIRKPPSANESGCTGR